MNATPRPNPGRRRGRGHAVRALALAAIVVGLIASGCIQNSDPRNQSSRIDNQGSHALNVQSGW
jgi:hypothetical protein